MSQAASGDSGRDRDPGRRARRLPDPSSHLNARDRLLTGFQEWPAHSKGNRDMGNPGRVSSGLATRRTGSWRVRAGALGASEHLHATLRRGRRRASRRTAARRRPRPDLRAPEGRSSRRPGLELPRPAESFRDLRRGRWDLAWGRDPVASSTPSPNSPTGSPTGPSQGRPDCRWSKSPGQSHPLGRPHLRQRAGGQGLVPGSELLDAVSHDARVEPLQPVLADPRDPATTIPTTTTSSATSTSTSPIPTSSKLDGL